MDNEAWVLVEPGKEPAFEARLARLNRKAQQLGVAQIEVIEKRPKVFDRAAEFVGRGRDFLLTTLTAVGEGKLARRPVILTEIRIRFPIIRLAGWEVIGRLEQTDGGVLAFSTTPSPSHWPELDRRATEGLRCEHCHTKRNRRDAYVLRSDLGETRTVGGSCLEDYTGVDPAAALFLAQLYQLIRVVEGEAEGFFRGGAPNAVRTDDYVAAVIATIRRGSFVSSAAARDYGGEATWQTALQWALDSRDAPCAATTQVVRELRTASRADGLVGFDRNAAILLGQDYLALKPLHLALVAAAVSRHLSRHTLAPVRHAGTPGAFWEGMVRLVRRVELPNPYSRLPRWLLLLDTEEGARLAWRTSAAPLELLESQGDTVAIRAKVKEHATYDGVPQTVVTHLQIVADGARRAA